MTRLSVNVNKIATLRNARGGNTPNLIKAVKDIESYGAEGITVHPRPDERHITERDVYDLKPLVKTEFNIEGYPSDRFMRIIEDVRPTQVTLVPDSPEVLTSNAGWNPEKEMSLLTEVIETLKSWGCRVSIFLDPKPSWVEAAAKTGANRIELYTEAYAKGFPTKPEQSVASYRETAKLASDFGLGINAGHDLDANNLKYFLSEVPNVLEVSIGHALISDALYWGLENTVQLYKRALV